MKGNQCLNILRIIRYIMPVLPRHLKVCLREVSDQQLQGEWILMLIFSRALADHYIMLAKGNRSRQVIDACKKYGGFYLGSIGGPAAILAAENIKSVEIVDFEELGMEAIRKIRVENMPAFIITDDKGNDFFDEYNK